MDAGEGSVDEYLNDREMELEQVLYGLFIVMRDCECHRVPTLLSCLSVLYLVPLGAEAMTSVILGINSYLSFDRLCTHSIPNQYSVIFDEC